MIKQIIVIIFVIFSDTGFLLKVVGFGIFFCLILLKKVMEKESKREAEHDIGVY